MHVSVTRLHLKSWLSFPVFAWSALAATRQARRTRGFVSGWVGGESLFGNWTATVWESGEAMRAFRNSGVHMKVMPRLLHWCDEASYTHWEQADATPPSGEAAYDRLAREGRLSKVLKPSPRHASGSTVAGRKPRPGPQLKPLR